MAPFASLRAMWHGRAFVREAHAGAVEFAESWAKEGNAEISARAAQAMIAAVLDHPTPALAHMLKDLEFEDPMAHAGLRPLIGANPEISLWKEGAAVLGGGGFRKNARGARRPNWEPWGGLWYFGLAACFAGLCRAGHRAYWRAA